MDITWSDSYEQSPEVVKLEKKNDLYSPWWKNRTPWTLKEMSHIRETFYWGSKAYAEIREKESRDYSLFGKVDKQREAELTLFTWICDSL